MEVLKLEFDASAESLVVTVDAVAEDGTILAGAPFPTTRLLLSELSPELDDAFRSVLAALEPIARAKATAVTTAEVVERAADLARREQALVAEEKSARERLAAVENHIRALNAVVESKTRT